MTVICHENSLSKSYPDDIAQLGLVGDTTWDFYVEVHFAYVILR